MSSSRTLIKVGEFLLETGKFLFAEADLHKLLPLAMDKVIEQTKAQRGMIIVYSPEGDLLFQVARDHHQKDIEQPEKQISTTIVQRVRESGQCVVIKNAKEDPSFDKSLSIRSIGILSVAGAPLRHEGEFLGVIYIDNRDLKAVFDDETGKLLGMFAELISVAVKRALDWRKLQERQRELQDALEGYGDIIGRSQAMQKIYKLIEKVAATDITALITGESGTGKELIARALHRKSSRCNHRFEALNCAELASGLAESELFGIEEKTATGVKKHVGFIERANGGTLFIDEVGDMPMSIQLKLLRVLQERSLRRVGGDAEIPIDMRIVVATNRDLRALIKHGQFREDLFYRLNVIRIELPPLRDRGDDIVLLAEYFLKRYAQEFKRPIADFSPDARRLLALQHFPGNVRELDNIIQRTVVLKDGPIIEAEDLVFENIKNEPLLESSYNSAFMKWEYEYLIKLLEKSGGNVTEAARLADIHITTIHRRLKLHNIDSQRFK